MANLHVARAMRASSPPRGPGGRFYRPELDGLRFFAFLAVYINHTLLLDPGRGEWWKRAAGSIGTAGAFGVDLFFALSAYLITELLLQERDASGQLDVPAFYMRRILRIWPLYFVFIAAMVGVARVLPSEEMTWRYAVALVLFCGNWMYMAHPIRTMAAPLWSVSVEEQFYLLWPWVVRAGSRRRIAGVSVVLIVAAFVVSVALPLAGIGEPFISKNSLVRADGIATGALLATVLRGEAPHLGPLARWTLMVVACITFVVVGGTFDLFHTGARVLQTATGYPLVAAAAAAILVAAIGADGVIGRVLRRREVIYLGRISYGLYVFHQVGLAIADHLSPGYLRHTSAWLGHFTIGLGITVALAAVSYTLLEQPFLRLKRQRFTVLPSPPAAVTAPAVAVGA